MVHHSIHQFYLLTILILRTTGRIVPIINFT